MEEDLVNIRHNFWLTEEEQVNFSNGFSDNLEAQEQLSLLGLLILDQVLNREAFKTSMQTL